MRTERSYLSMTLIATSSATAVLSDCSYKGMMCSKTAATVITTEAPKR